VQRTTFLPSVSPANCATRSSAASLVSRVGTSSTRGSTGTGLKKCSPSTRLGFFVAAAIFMIGMLDVFDASTASGSVMASSSCAKTFALTAASSTIASTTSWRSARSATSVATLNRASASSRSASVSLPRLTPRSSDATMRPRPASTSASVGS
jgi:hypothetical protein